MYLRIITSNFLLITLLAWILLPIFIYNDVIRFLALASITIFIVKNFSISNKKVFLAISFFILYTFIINTSESSSNFFLRHLQLYIFFALIFLSTIVLKFSTERKNQLILIILIFNLIVLIGTFLGLLTDDHVARALSKSSESSIELTERGIGGYGHIYMNVVLYPLLFIIKKKIKNNLINFLASVNLIAIVTTILFSNYLIAILLLLFHMIYLLASSTNGIIRFVYILSSIIIILVAYVNVDYIQAKTYPFVENTSLRYKHEDIFNQIKGKKAFNSTVDVRSERYTRSLKIFFNNPITGNLSFDNVGKHSNILDFFAQFGLFVGVLFIFIIIKLPLIFLKKSEFSNKNYIRSFILSLIILGLFNNFSMQHGILYIVIACLITYEDIDLNKIS